MLLWLARADLQNLRLGCHGDALARNVKVALRELSVPPPGQLRLVPPVHLRPCIAAVHVQGALACPPWLSVAAHRHGQPDEQLKLEDTWRSAWTMSLSLMRLGVAVPRSGVDCTTQDGGRSG